MPAVVLCIVYGWVTCTEWRVYSSVAANVLKDEDPPVCVSYNSLLTVVSMGISRVFLSQNGYSSVTDYSEMSEYVVMSHFVMQTEFSDLLFYVIFVSMFTSVSN